MGIIQRIRQAVSAVVEAERNRQDLEQTRVQLAGCAVAALGYISEPHRARQGQYGWSASYGDVYNLRRRFDYIEAELRSLASTADCVCLMTCVHRWARAELGVLSAMAANRELR